MRTLHEWERELEKLSPPSSIKLGLDRVRIILDRMAIVYPKHIFTVAGTNGKGSTVEMLAALATEAGLKTCQYTSPHLHNINERFRINLRPISDEDLVDAFESVQRSQDGKFLTYFEILTLAAFHAFSAIDADVWILEIGLGGRLDAVNVVDPDVSIITSIAMDHTEYLGETIEKIGLEKAGIMRQGFSVLTAAETVRSTLATEAERLGSEIKWLSDYLTGSVFTRAGHTFDLTGCSLPKVSVGLALMAFLERKLKLPEHAQQLVNSVTMSGRLSPARYAEHSVTLDVGHNLGAFEYVTRVMSERIRRSDRVVIFSALADKDADALIACLDEYSDRLVLVGIIGDRGRSAEELAIRYKSATGKTPWKTFDTLVDALEKLSKDLEPDDHILICGSFILVADALQHDRIN